MCDDMTIVYDKRVPPGTLIVGSPGAAVILSDDDPSFPEVRVDLDKVMVLRLGKD
jgi:hypothetical protein